MYESTAPGFLFEDVFPKTVVARFDGERRTSDAGLSLLAALDRKLGLTESLGKCLPDARSPARVVHGRGALLRQRIFSIAVGAPDANDAAHLAHDPVLMLACGRSTKDVRGLGSQSTQSRFEHGVSGRELITLQRELEDFAVERLRRRHRRSQRVFIDLDPTVDPTHGQQPFSFFNGHYDTWCYLPMLGFLTVDGEPEQHLFHARLRAGSAKEVKGTPALLRRIVDKVRRACRKARICVRLDAGFAYPQILALLDELRVEYMVAMGGNAVLERLSRRHMAAAAHLTEQFGKSTALFGEASYKTCSWEVSRRIVFKAEVLRVAGKEDRANDRYVITNLHDGPERVWRLYCERGDSENRIKELKNDLGIDRTSCSRFLPNQLRVLMTAAAFVLFQELRVALAETELHRAMVSTLRLRLVKIGATITESVRRIVISMPASHPWKDLWRRAATRVAAMA